MSSAHAKGRRHTTAQCCRSAPGMAHTGTGQSPDHLHSRVDTPLITWGISVIESGENPRSAATTPTLPLAYSVAVAEGCNNGEAVVNITNSGTGTVHANIGKLHPPGQSRGQPSLRSGQRPTATFTSSSIGTPTSPRPEGRPRTGVRHRDGVPRATPAVSRPALSILSHRSHPNIGAAISPSQIPAITAPSATVVPATVVPGHGCTGHGSTN